MIRTQISLEREQADALKELAATRGVSMANLIRAAVDQLLSDSDRESLWSSARAVVGKHRSGQADVGRNHDTYVAEQHW